MAQKKFLSQDGLAVVWDRINEVFVPKDDVQSIISQIKLPEYSVIELETPNEGATKSYRLTKDGQPAGTDIDLPAAIVADYTVSISEQVEGLEAGVVKRYTFSQMGQEIGHIDLPQDKVLSQATLEKVVIEDIPYDGARPGDPYIRLIFNDAAESVIYIPVKDLVDVYEAGEGVEIAGNVISIKIANDSHGLVAVDGTLALNLATRESDGAMSKEDKRIVDAIPYAYVARKFDISGTPEGTLIDYRDYEIRIMCPKDAEFVKQSVGVGGDPNTYYITLKTYVPDARVTGYKEHLNNQSDSEILTTFSYDEFGRRYQPTWLGVAVYNPSTDSWNYYGKNSSMNKYIGWDYRIDWYDANGKMIYSDSTRINLSNEECHNNSKPYFMANYATSEEIIELKEVVSDAAESYTWGEI